jgi:hypothetical protein
MTRKRDGDGVLECLAAMGASSDWYALGFHDEPTAP